MGSIDRVAQYSDQFRPRYGRVDATLSVEVGQVERGTLSAQHPGRCVLEERLVTTAVPDPLPVAVRISGTSSPARWTIAHEVLRFFDLRHEQLGMSVEGGVQRRGPRLGSTDHEEVGQAHEDNLIDHGANCESIPSHYWIDGQGPRLRRMARGLAT